jgi:hypothetical protein
MAELCLVSHGQPSANPRLVRDAGVLAAAGHAVRVVTTQHINGLDAHDARLVSNVKWVFEPVDLGRGAASKKSWNYIRARRRLASTLSKWFLYESLIARAYAYGTPELTRTARAKSAQLFIAYQHNSLPAAARAAKAHGAMFALDAQDLLADCSAELPRIAATIERRYLHECSYVSTMSQPAAERLSVTNGLKRQPLVLHNTPSIREREGLERPERRGEPANPSLYWFGQTIGFHSCGLQVVRALPLLKTKVRLVLRGTPDGNFLSTLKALATDLGVSDQVEILPRAEPMEMVKLAAGHDILLGTQPGTQLFNQMAIGNKVFTGMMAGLALALTDTIAHRQLMQRAKACGFLFPDGDHERLASRLNELLCDPIKLAAAKKASWELAEDQFNWEIESKSLVDTVNRLFEGCRAQQSA